MASTTMVSGNRLRVHVRIVSAFVVKGRETNFRRLAPAHGTGDTVGVDI